ncbi:hypothetical protein D3C84_1205640 [compost metagenome]
MASCIAGLVQALRGFKQRRRNTELVGQDGRQPQVLEHQLERELYAIVFAEQLRAFELGGFARTAARLDKLEEG